MTAPVDLHPAAERLAGLVENLPPEALDRPTPCEQYSVAALLDHLHGSVLAFRAAAIKSPLPGGPSGDPGHLVADWRTRIPNDARALADDGNVRYQAKVDRADENQALIEARRSAPHLAATG